MDQIEKLQAAYPDYKVVDTGRTIELVPRDMHPVLPRLGERALDSMETAVEHVNSRARKLAQSARLGMEF